MKKRIGIVALAALFLLCGCGAQASGEGLEGPAGETPGGQEPSGSQQPSQPSEPQQPETQQQSEAYLMWEDAVASGYEGDFLQFLETYFAAEQGAAYAPASVVCVQSVTLRRMGAFGASIPATTVGSGVIWRMEEGDAYILTNYHVVYDSRSLGNERIAHISDDITVSLFGGDLTEYGMRATCLGGSLLQDIAVLKVEGEESAGAATNAELLASARIAPVETEICAGEKVFVVGNADGKGISVTSGVVSVESETIEETRLDGAGTVLCPEIRTDAPINHGNSGGGLFNGAGELIGIVNARSEASGIVDVGYAIPVQLAVCVAESVLYGEGRDRGVAVYADLGAAWETVGLGGEETEAGMQLLERMEIVSVESDGAAAGVLLPGDVILGCTLGGSYTRVRLGWMLTALLYTVREGDTLTFTLLRGGEEREVSLSFGQEDFTS